MLPSGYFKDDAMEFHRLSRSCTNTGSAPKLIASIIITENLLPSGYVYFPKKMYKRIFSSALVSTLREVSYILAFCKNLSNDCLDDFVNKTVLVKTSVDALEQYLDTATKVGDENNFFSLVQFLLKQIKLILIDLMTPR